MALARLPWTHFRYLLRVKARCLLGRAVIGNHYCEPLPFGVVNVKLCQLLQRFLCLSLQTQSTAASSISAPASKTVPSSSTSTKEIPRYESPDPGSVNLSFNLFHRDVGSKASTSDTSGRRCFLSASRWEQRPGLASGLKHHPAGMLQKAYARTAELLQPPWQLSRCFQPKLGRRS